ncbi:MAG: hypothetical protein IJL80_03990 [Treponema sp.]|nr:hypothetical protein [Treponema sp.]
MPVNVILIAVNTILWLVMFWRLKRKLSPEGVIKDVRAELDKILLQINSDSDRNIRLIQNQIDQVKKVSLEAQQLCERAEERIAMLYGELDKAASARSVEEQLYRPVPEASEPDKAIEPVPAAEPRAGGSESKAGPSASVPHEDTLNKSLSPLGSYMKEQLRFVPESARTPEPAPSAQEAPRKIEIPEFIKAEKPIEIKKPFRQQVKEMLALGYSVEEIAHKTGRSTQEVKIIIEIL